MVKVIRDANKKEAQKKAIRKRYDLARRLTESKRHAIIKESIKHHKDPNRIRVISAVIFVMVAILGLLLMLK